MAEQERRRYVRVDDTVLLRYQPLSDESELNTELVEGAHFTQKLQALENKLRVQLPRSRQRHPELVELLDLINMKLNILADELSQKELSDDALVARDVSLSACGVAFPATEKAGVDDDLWMELVLQPHMIKIQCKAKVVACEKIEEDERFSYLIRVEFQDLVHDEQECLIQHVLRRESQLLKQKRMEREQQSDDDSEGDSESS